MNLTPVAETPQAQICCRKEALESVRGISEEEKYVVRPKGNLCVQARSKVYKGKVYYVVGMVICIQANKTHEYLNIQIDPPAEKLNVTKVEEILDPKPTFAEVEVEGTFGKSLDRFLDENPSSPDSKQAREELHGPELLIPELPEEEISRVEERKEAAQNVEGENPILILKDLKQAEASADFDSGSDKEKLPDLDSQAQIESIERQKEGETEERSEQVLEEVKEEVSAVLQMDTKGDEEQTAPYPTSLEGGFGQDSSRQDPQPSMPSLLSPDVSPETHPGYKAEYIPAPTD